MIITRRQFLSSAAAAALESEDDIPVADRYDQRDNGHNRKRRGQAFPVSVGIAG